MTQDPRDQGELTGRGEEELAQRLIGTMWAYGGDQRDLGRAFARRMKLHQSDAGAIVLILRAEERGHPVTPRQLGELIGLSSGATTLLLNRLEEAGHLMRRRGHTDRRTVTLHLTPSIRSTAAGFFDPVRDDLASVLSTHHPDQLALVQTLLDALRGVVIAHTQRSDEAVRAEKAIPVDAADGDTDVPS